MGSRPIDATQAPARRSIGTLRRAGPGIVGAPWSGALPGFVGDKIVGSAPACRGADQRGPLAQLEEQLTLNQPVLGSSPRRLTTHPSRFPYDPREIHPSPSARCGPVNGPCHTHATRAPGASVSRPRASRSVGPCCDHAPDRSDRPDLAPCASCDRASGRPAGRSGAARATAIRPRWCTALRPRRRPCCASS